jgi:hypothetical protein
VHRRCAGASQALLTRHGTHSAHAQAIATPLRCTAWPLCGALPRAARALSTRVDACQRAATAALRNRGACDSRAQMWLFASPHQVALTCAQQPCSACASPRWWCHDAASQLRVARRTPELLRRAEREAVAQDEATRRQCAVFCGVRAARLCVAPCGNVWRCARAPVFVFRVVVPSCRCGAVCGGGARCAAAAGTASPLPSLRRAGATLPTPAHCAAVAQISLCLRRGLAPSAPAPTPRLPRGAAASPTAHALPRRAHGPNPHPARRGRCRRAPQRRRASGRRGRPTQLRPAAPAGCSAAQRVG